MIFSVLNMILSFQQDLLQINVLVMMHYGILQKRRQQMLSMNVASHGKSMREKVLSMDQKLISRYMTLLDVLINVEQFSLTSNFQLDLIYNIRVKLQLRSKKSKMNNQQKRLKCVSKFSQKMSYVMKSIFGKSSN